MSACCRALGLALSVESIRCGNRIRTSSSGTSLGAARPNATAPDSPRSPRGAQRARSHRQPQGVHGEHDPGLHERRAATRVHHHREARARPHGVARSTRTERRLHPHGAVEEEEGPRHQRVHEKPEIPRRHLHRQPAVGGEHHRDERPGGVRSREARRQHPRTCGRQDGVHDDLDVRRRLQGQREVQGQHRRDDVRVPVGPCPRGVATARVGVPVRELVEAQQRLDHQVPGRLGVVPLVPSHPPRVSEQGPEHPAQVHGDDHERREPRREPRPAQRRRGQLAAQLQFDPPLPHRASPGVRTNTS